MGERHWDVYNSRVKRDYYDYFDFLGGVYNQTFHGRPHLMKASVLYPNYPSRDKLVPDGIRSLTTKTESNLKRLRRKLVAVDPCYEFGIEHWHPPLHSTETPQDAADELPEHARPKWKEQKTIFATRGDMENMYFNTPDKENGQKSGPVNKLCYLCTTLEEHQQHLARRGPQLKPKPKRKPRIEFIAPPPFVKKKEELPEEKKEVLYKVTVRTGNKPNAGTGAKVFLKMRGQLGIMRQQELKKKMSVSMYFARGSTEVFHLRGPKLGELRDIKISHDGLEKKDSWYLEEVEVSNLQTDQTWLFPCQQWLSLFLGDHVLTRMLPGVPKEREQREYEVTVVTGHKAMAGTSANVFLTLYGKKGVSKKIKLGPKDKESFNRGHEDRFEIVIDDLGSLSRIRIEHDNTGKSPEWLLDRVIIKDLERADKTYVFPCGEWLAQDEEGGALHQILYPITKATSSRTSARRRRKSEDEDGPLLKYDVTVLTGTVRGAGTDANVYLQMYGNGRTREIRLDDEKDNFENGQTDKFKIEAEDVGVIKKIKIRHDNTGLAPGWFLDTITIKKHFSRAEIAERMGDMEAAKEVEAIQKMAEMTGQVIEKTPEKMKYRKSVKKGKFHRNDSDSEGTESEEDYKPWKKKEKKKKKYSYSGIDTLVTESETESEGDRKSKKGKTLRRKSRSKHDSESDTESEESERKMDVGQKGKIPFCDEYLFECHQWFAKDEGDGKVERELKPQSVTTLYKMGRR